MSGLRGLQHNAKPTEDQNLQKVLNGFLENPELTLTLPQAERRFDVDEVTCQVVLGALVDAGVLAKAHGGAYVRLFPRLVRTSRAGASATARTWAGHAA